ncbi:hypothetical protein ACGC1H_004816 [Rhizoctonia solani]
MAATVENPFHDLGEFDWAKKSEPARSLPPILKEIQLDSRWIVEFLDVTDSDEFTKNHIVSRVLFTQPYVREGGDSYLGALISMELTDTLFDVVEEEELGVYFHHDLLSGDDYFPGTFTVKLVNYTTAPRRSLNSINFGFVESLTLGELVDLVLEEAMDESVFMLHNDNWKGCGDFIMQLWALLVRKNKLNMLPEEDPTLLSRALCITYSKGGHTIDCPVGKGCWLHWVRFTTDEDGMIPPGVYST